MTPDQQRILDKVKADFQLIQAVEDAFARVLPVDFRTETTSNDFVSIAGFKQPKSEFEMHIQFKQRQSADYYIDKMSCYREINSRSTPKYSLQFLAAAFDLGVIIVKMWNRNKNILYLRTADPAKIALEKLMDDNPDFNIWLSNKILGVE